MADYPTRPKFWALTVIRALQKTGAANHIGRDAAWIITNVAAMEDTKRYSGAVAYWNDHLRDVAGFTSKKTFDKARKAAVNAGWLHYEPGGKGRAGLYWTLIPKDAEQFIGLSVVDPDVGSKTDNAAPNVGSKDNLSPQIGGDKGAERGEERGEHSYPVPNPFPIEGDSGSESPALVTFCRTWNQWQADGIVKRRVKNPDSPGKTIREHWKRGQKDPEQRERLADLSTIRTAIETANGFLFDAGWFDAAGLVGGKNKDRRFYCEMLLNGAYSDNGSRTPSADDDELWQRLTKFVARQDASQPITPLICAEFGDDVANVLTDELRPANLYNNSTARDRDRQRKLFFQRYGRPAA